VRGAAGLQENFNHYYRKIMERNEAYPMTSFQRNRLYEQFRMAEAFYHSLVREPSLSTNERTILENQFTVLREQILRIQQRAGDFDLRAV
jgi:hypothetical protein